MHRYDILKMLGLDCKVKNGERMEGNTVENIVMI